MPVVSHTLIAIALMAAVTYLTRLVGPWLGSSLAARPALERGLRHMSTSLLAALVAPALTSGDLARAVGVAVACTIMLLSRKALPAMTAGAAAAALLRFF